MINKKYQAALLILSILICQDLFSISNIINPTHKQKKFYSINIAYQPGNVMQTHPFYQGSNPSNEAYEYFHSFYAKFQINTRGDKMWEQLYAYPSWGFGLYKCFFSNDHGELGNPAAAYAYLDLPLKRYKKWSINMEINFGLAFNWKKHLFFDQGFNYPIGTYFTVFFSTGFKGTIRLGPNIDMDVGFGFTHFSNGSLKLPNLGMNLVGPKLGLNYHIHRHPRFLRQPIPKYKKEWEYFVFLAPSMKQMGFKYLDHSADTIAVTFNYGIISLSTGINRQISHKIKFGGGIDITYNSSHGAGIEVIDEVAHQNQYKFKDQILVGLYPSFELLLNRFALVLQPGFYIYKKKLSGFVTPTSYQRVGLKYHFNNNLILGINIRAFQFSKADFIEWIIGYRIKWQKSYR